MVVEDARILPLPEEVSTHISSSVTIASFQDAVIGLVENALDAQAQRINVRINPRNGYCAVEDDGGGIPAVEFEERGGLGKRFRM